MDHHDSHSIKHSHTIKEYIFGQASSDLGDVSGMEYDQLDSPSMRPTNPFASKLSMISPKSDDLFDELVYLNGPFELRLLPKYSCTFIELLWPSLSTSVTFIGYILLLTLGFIACSRANDPLQFSALSMTVFLYLLSFRCWNRSMLEKAGIILSQSFGIKNYSKMKKYFIQSFMTTATYYLTAGTIVVIYLKEFLILVNFREDLAEITNHLFRAYMLPDFLRFTSEMIQLYAQVQGIESKPIGPIILNLIVSAGLMIYLCFYLGMTTGGWILACLFFQVVNLLIMLRIYFTNCRPETKGLPTMAECLDGFLEFWLDWLKLGFALYIEYIGLELTAYFVALIGDIDQLAAFGTLNNILQIIISTQQGVRISARVRINNLLSRGYHAAAKRCFLLILTGIIVMNLMVGVVMFMAKDMIAELYAGPMLRTRHYVSLLLDYFCFLMSGDLIFNLVTLVARSIDHIGFSIALNVVLLVVILTSTNYLMAVVYHKDVLWLMMNLYFTLAASCIIQIVKLVAFDWSKATLQV